MCPWFDFFGERLYTFPIVLSIAFSLCIAIYEKRKCYNKIYRIRFFKMVCISSVFALFGGKISSAFSLVSQGKGDFWYCFLHSGNIFYGCMIFGTISFIILSKAFQLNPLDVLDICASLLPLGQAIGRIGCFFNGCCYGIEYAGPFAVNYPINGGYKSIFPTWFCESIFCFILFLFLQKILPHMRRGTITSIYLLAYSVFRFFIEFLRGDAIRGKILFFSTSQFLSLFVFVFGIFIFIFSIKNRYYNNMILESDKIER